jgi:hypothetical protein
MMSYANSLPRREVDGLNKLIEEEMDRLSFMFWQLKVAGAVRNDRLVRL